MMQQPKIYVCHHTNASNLEREYMAQVLPYIGKKLCQKHESPPFTRMHHRRRQEGEAYLIKYLCDPPESSRR